MEESVIFNYIMPKNKYDGFTIVELLVVIVVIGILAAITIVAYTGISQKAAVASLQSDLTNASQQLKLYQVQDSSGNYPNAIDCSATPAANTICIKSSSSNTYSYTPSNNITPKTFTIDAINGSTKYRVTNDSSPIQISSLELNSYSTLFNDANLIYYYRLEGNSNDSKGTNNGVDTSITYSTSNGKFGQGAGFNGTSSVITLADILDGATTFTFNAWINKSSKGIGSGILYFKSDCLMFGNYDGSSYFRFRVRNAAGTWVGTADADYPYNTGEWHMVTGTFDSAGGANNLKLYLDGALWQQGTLATGGVQGGNAFVLGGRGGEYFNGKMDDVAIFSRVLSATEIGSLYNGY